MLRVNELRLPIEHNEADIKKKIKRLLNTDVPFEYEIVRRSLDSRKKNELIFSYVVDISIPNEEKILKRADKKVTRYKPIIYSFPFKADSINENDRPVIIGMGPAGLFAGLYLARNGYRPIIFERGKDVDKRTDDVETFFKTGVLDTESNVQFGEGGAGAFSDGKLNTLVKERSGRNRAVLRDFVNAGALSDIMYDAKPHIGTDILKTVIKNIRNEIIKLGGEVHFESRMSDIYLDDKNTVSGIRINDSYDVKCSRLILAIGHSARDTFFRLKELSMNIEPKPFAVGLRVSHDARLINNYAYGASFNEKLGNYSYKVTHTCSDGRGVYSFCMCPGGYVLNASSEKGMLAVNGMSYSKRDSSKSNSAIILTVKPEDFVKDDDPLSGIYFQRELERKAYEAGHSKIPVETYGEFKNEKLDEDIKIDSLTCGEVSHGAVHEILPKGFNEDFVEGMEAFGKIIKGFDSDDTVLYGVESRTSCPVKLLRDENGMSSLGNVYVSGEGAGYAGGIMSAAMDGILIAEKVAEAINNGKSQ